MSTTWGLNDAAFSRFMSLPIEDQLQATYVWIGGNGGDLRAKSRTLPLKDYTPKELPEWNYDGSSTNQAPGDNSEVLIVPVRVFPCPFRMKPNLLVLCEAIHPLTREPIATNTRNRASKIFEHPDVMVEDPWYGIEQEYTLFESDGVTPLGWPQFGYPGPQGPYYCSAGARRAYGRQIVESHYRACLYAGIQVSGTNAEVMAGQWEYQVGPVLGIDSPDQLVMSRYIMERVTEQFQVVCSFHPKPIAGDWNGAGCHTNYSTKTMREEGGYEKIIEAVERLGKKHAEHIKLYGEDNDKRLTGEHETANIGSFKYGVADRGASIRIPNDAKKNGYGYFEDRRPASNMDPYVVTAKIAETTILWDKAEKPLLGE